MLYNISKGSERMFVQYIDHSGFYVEGEENCLLFDYYRGELPPVPAGKRLTVFASHHHPDHYVSEIFRYGETAPDARYMLGCDITLNAANRARMGVSDEIFARCRRLHRGDVVENGGVRLRALRSTDMGVAFYVEFEGRAVYHAGDHNLWLWREDANFDRAQIARFYEEIETLRGLRVDAAFLPLDPRLGEAYWRGFDAFARLVAPERIFPMHMVDDYAIIGRMKALPQSAPYRERIMEIGAPGARFEI